MPSTKQRTRLANLNRALILASTLATAALGAPPDVTLAATPIGIQDDEGGKYAHEAFTERAEQVGASWVRVTIPIGRWRMERDAYAASVRRHAAAGRQVMVSLMSWDVHPTPREWAPFVADVVAELADDVDAWSPVNEPNQDNMRMACRRRCGWGARGRAYRRTWDLVAPIIEAGDPTATRVVFDGMPVKARRFMRAFYRGGRPRVRAHVLGIHPYLADVTRRGSWSAGDVRDAKRFARGHDLALWATEFSLVPKDQRPRRWRRLLARFAKVADVVFLYDVDSRATDGWWDTRLSAESLAAVASR